MAIQNLSITDSRASLRVSLRTPKEISGDIKAKLVDISTNGICFTCADSDILHKELSIQVGFFSEILNFVIKPIWKKAKSNSTDTHFGASIIKSKPSDSLLITKTMLYEQFRKTVSSVGTQAGRKHIFKFCKALGRYVLTLAELDGLLDKKAITKEEAYETLKNSTDSIVLDGENLNQKLNNKLILGKIQEEFRRIVAPWAYKSLIVKHSYDKPRGYPGDYETLEVIYDKKVITPENVLGKLYDTYFLSNPYADAVRNRKNYIKSILIDELARRKESIKILNLACGSSREIREIFAVQNNDFMRKIIQITCLDWESDALLYSENALRNLPSNVKIEWLKEDILRYAKSTSFFELRGKYDLIYSIGLADYLPDRVNKKIIQTSYEGLREGGMLIFAHKNREVLFSHLPPEWFCDWEFIPRNKEEAMELFYSLNLRHAKYQIDWDSTGDVFFIRVTKDSASSLTKQPMEFLNLNPPDWMTAEVK